MGRRMGGNSWRNVRTAEKKGKWDDTKDSKQREGEREQIPLNSGVGLPTIVVYTNKITVGNLFGDN